MKWNRNGLPPSDPYKRYLVVYCPFDNYKNQHDAFYIRFDVASYYTGDGTYEKEPWHLTVTQSVTEKEIIAWADIGDAEDFKHYLHREPKPCPICGTKPIRKQCHFKVGEGENRYDNEHHEDGTLKWTWLECETCGRKTLAYCYEHQATDLWNEDKIDDGDAE